MNERKRFGHVVDKETGKVMGMVSALVARFNDGRGTIVARLDNGNYLIETISDRGEDTDIKNTMCLTKNEFMGLTSTIFLFLKKEKENLAGFVEMSSDECEGYIYKNVEDMQEE